MTKHILQIEELPEGGENPKTKLHEKTAWRIKFFDGEEKILVKYKIIEYLSMAYRKAVGHFEKRTVVTASGNTVVWFIIFQDGESGDLLGKNEFCTKLSDGHMQRNQEDVKQFQAPESPIFTDPITSPEERIKIDKFRNQAMKDEYKEIRRKAAEPHPNETGYTDTK
jgi:hypothetical protein|tara:strand:+ start:340 stop:840 length:501 start_codon:yes stop_codon:yes gene_type:complete